MIKAIMAVDERGGISKGKSMTWPKNSIDLKWFKENTVNNIVSIASFFILKLPSKSKGWYNWKER